MNEINEKSKNIQIPVTFNTKNHKELLEFAKNDVIVFTGVMRLLLEFGKMHFTDENGKLSIESIQKKLIENYNFKIE